MYSRIPIPKFYVVDVFESRRRVVYVGGVRTGKFVRFKLDHMQDLAWSHPQEWWVRRSTS